MAVLLGVLSCASWEAPEPLARPAVERSWATPDSLITLPIRIPLTQVAAWTQNLVPLTFSGSGSGQQTFSVLFVKKDWNYWWTYEASRSPLTLAFQGPNVEVSTRLTGAVSARWDTVPGQAKAPVEAVAKVRLGLALGTDWRLLSHAQVDLEVTKATLPIGFMLGERWVGWNINVTQPLHAALRPLLAPLGQELDRQLAQVDLRSSVEGLWNELQQPRKVPGTSELWFDVGPHSVAVGPLNVEDDGVELTLQVTTKLAVSPSPPAKRPLSPLPSLQELTPQKDGLSLVLPVSVTWEQVLREAEAHLPKDRTLRLPQGGALRIDGLKARTDGDRVQVRLQARASAGWGNPVPAVLWITAKPLWDPTARRLQLTEAKLEVQTRDLLAQVASWLLQTSWVTDLARTWDWNLGPELDRIQTELTAALTEVKLADHVALSATIGRVSVDSVHLAESGPEVLVHLAGSGHVSWRP